MNKNLYNFLLSILSRGTSVLRIVIPFLSIEIFQWQKAHAYIESNSNIGKVLLNVYEESDDKNIAYNNNNKNT